MTKLADIETEVRQYFSVNWTATDIAWPNRPYTPVTGVPWVSVAILPGNTFEKEIGVTPSAVGERTGVVIFSVFVPLSGGTLKASEYSDQIEALFRRRMLSTIYFGEPYTTLAGNDAPWYQMSVKCPFWAWV